MTASDPLFGAFITPVSSSPQQPVELAVAAEEAGLDLVTFQDHPYQPALLDAWTLLSYVAAKTERIRLAGNVLNLPLRPPATLARAAAALDLLSGGRFEMALGAGAFGEAIVAMGGPERAPGQGRRALDEAITIMREIWDTESRGGVRVDGDFYTVSGAKRGPAPAHPIEIWVGGYGPRMLELIGRRADGWMPSLSYLKDGVAALPGLNERIDQSALAAGRDPGDIRRFINLGGTFSDDRDGLLAGPPSSWAEDLAMLARDYRMNGFIFATDDPDELATIGAQVIPATRELLAD